MKKSSPSKSSPKTLKRKLDEIYSTYIRKNAADHDGYITCYCSVKVPWQESDCSHYIPRGCLALRYDERNTHPSCRRCNRFMHGNLQDYALFLQKTYGLTILRDLERQKHTIVKDFPYESLIELYTSRVKEL